MHIIILFISTQKRVQTLYIDVTLKKKLSMSFYGTNDEIIRHISVADPGFPVGGGGRQPIEGGANL